MPSFPGNVPKCKISVPIGQTRTGADKYKYAHGMLMRRRADAGLSGSQQRYIDQFIFDRPAGGLRKPISIKKLFAGAISYAVECDCRVSKGEIFVIDDDASTREMLSQYAGEEWLRRHQLR